MKRAGHNNGNGSPIAYNAQEPLRRQRLDQPPPRVDDEVRAVHARVVEQKQRRGDAIGGGHHPPARRLGARAFENRGIAGPGRRVADQAGVDRVDANRRDLERQRCAPSSSPRRSPR